MSWRASIACLLLLCIGTQVAKAEVSILTCQFPNFRSPVIITVYDDGSSARMGVEQGVGSRTQASFDNLTGAWIFVEFAGYGPFSLTTVLRDGAAWHSRHTLGVDGSLLASQVQGTCQRRSVR